MSMTRRAAELLRHQGPVSLGVLGLTVLVCVVGLHAGQPTLLSGAVFGSNIAFTAMALCLLYRSSRVINFAQLQVGAIPAVLFTECIRHGWLISAFGADQGAAAQGLVALNYAVAALGAVLLGPALSLGVYLLVGRALATSARIVATVATIGAGLVLAWGAGELEKQLNPDQGPGVSNAVDVRPPGNFSAIVASTPLNLGELLTVGTLAASLGLTLFWLRRSRAGVAIRAAAENEERAKSLGISPVGVQAAVWGLAGLFGSLAAILGDMGSGSGGAGGVSPALLVVCLAAAVIASLDSLPIAVLAALVIGVLQQSILGDNLDSGWRDVATLAMILGVLLLRPTERLTRAQAASQDRFGLRMIRATPRALRTVPSVRRLRGGTVIAIALLALAVPFVLSPSDVNLAGQDLTYAIVGLSILVLCGWSGQISLGQFGIAAVGAWVAAVLAGMHGWPFGFAVVAGAVAGAVAALLVGVPALRLRGLSLAIATLAFAQAAQTVLFGNELLGRYLPDHLDRPGILGLDGNDERVYYYVLLVALVVALIGVRGIRESRSGRALIAARDNEAATEAFGIDLLRTRLAGFAVSGFLAGGAGALFAFGVQTPSPGAFTPAFSQDLLLMVVLGGLGALSGPLLGVVYLGVVSNVFSAGSGASAAIGVAVLVMLIAAPGGVSQVIFGARDAILRRIADRHGIVVETLADTSVEDIDGRRRARLLPKVSATGGEAFVPRRYRLERPALPAEVLR